MKTVEQRFWEKVYKTTNCWFWLGARVSQNDYGGFWDGERKIGAHVYSWFLRNGRMPEKGQHVDHLCQIPQCVNPDHLEAVSPSISRERGHCISTSGQNTAKEAISIHRKAGCVWNAGRSRIVVRYRSMSGS